MNIYINATPKFAEDFEYDEPTNESKSSNYFLRQQANQIDQE